ncbi:Ephrin type-B receptor 1, partial [Paramuricea clavata]
MAATLHGRCFLGMSFQVICVLATLVLFANADKGDTGIGQPRFTYIERYLVKIVYGKGENRTLYICCKTRFPQDHVLAKFSCGVLSKSMCPQFKIFSRCKTRGQQVYCEANGVHNRVTLEAYVAWFDGNTTVPLSDVATYVTNQSEIVPKSVSDVKIATNSQQGLEIRWTKYEYFYIDAEKYEYLIDCQPRENQRAKAFRKSVGITDSFLVTDSKNITAVCKYRCCVQVVNLVNSQPSEPTCRNITTSEQAPSAGPVISCANGTVPCPSVIKGTKRNITIPFELPSPEHQNGKIISHEVYYRSVVSRNFTKLVINGSQTEAVIMDAETGMSYYVFMKSCTEIGCSPISNTIRIPAVSLYQKAQHTFVTLAVPVGITVVVVVILVAIGCFFRRQYQHRRQKTLPTLNP